MCPRQQNQEGKVLVEFLACGGDGDMGVVEQDRARRRGSLIDGKNVIGHGASFSQASGVMRRRPAFGSVTTAFGVSADIRSDNIRSTSHGGPFSGGCLFSLLNRSGHLLDKAIHQVDTENP